MPHPGIDREQWARSPHLQPVGRSTDTVDERADELLRLACLTYGDPDLSRPQRARDLLDQDPGLASHSIYTMAASGSTEGIAAIVAESATAANELGGPFVWAPPPARPRSGQGRRGTMGRGARWGPPSA